MDGIQAAAADPEQKKSERRQTVFIILCCLVYSFAYAGRYSYSANIAPVMNHYGVTHAEAGLVGTFFFFAYGGGQLLNGILCKYYNKKIVISAALFLSAVINGILIFDVPFAIIKYLWLLNGITQSVLWPSLILAESETLDAKMLKRAVFLMSFSVLLGTLLAYGGSALFNLIGSFRLSFLSGAVLMTVIGLVWLFSYRRLTAYPSANAAPEAMTEDGEKKGRAVAGALVGLIVVSCVFAIVDNFVKDGMNTWMPVILKEAYGFGDSISIVLTLVLPIFGVFGSALALQTNRWLKDFRAVIGFLYFMLAIVLLGILYALRAENTLILFLVCQGALSCLTHGVNAVLTSIMPFALREKINSGFLAGLLNACCYVGSTASAYGLGKIADGTGWDPVILILLFTAAGAAILAGVIFLIGKLRKKNAKA